MSGSGQRGFAATAGWLIVWCLVAALAYLMSENAKKERLTLKASLEKQMQVRVQQNQNELSILEQEVKRKAREAEANRRVETEKVWGEPIGAAFKNPAYSLRQALQRAAEACAPTNSLVSAEVDRFTEFIVTFDGAENLSTNQMVAIARKLMPRAKEYLHALRFSTKGKLIAEIDRQDMEFIQDWARVPDQRVTMLLTRESRSRIQEDPMAIERLRDEQRISEALANAPVLRDKAERADKNLRRALEEAYAEFTKAMEALGRAMSFAQARSLSDLDRCDKELRAAGEHKERSRKFWDDPAKEWQRLLETEGISGDLRDILVNSFPAIFRHKPEKTAKVFEALEAEMKSARRALLLLLSESGKLRFSSDGITFRDVDVAQRFDRAERQIRDDAQELEAALRAWREAIGP